jgi:hypothetical protein
MMWILPEIGFHRAEWPEPVRLCPFNANQIIEAPASTTNGIAAIFIVCHP